MKEQNLHEEFMTSVSDTVIAELTRIKPVVFVGALSYGSSGPEDDTEFTRLCDRALRGIMDPILDQGYEPVFLAVLELALKFVHWVCREAATKNPSRFRGPDEYSVDTLFNAVIGSEFLGNLCRYCTLVTREKFGSIEAAERVFDEVGSKLNEALRASQVRLAARVLFALIVMLAQIVFRESLVRVLAHAPMDPRALVMDLLSGLDEDLAKTDGRADPNGFVKPTKGEA
jgi:hypothetical protein